MPGDLYIDGIKLGGVTSFEFKIDVAEFDIALEKLVGKELHLCPEMCRRCGNVLCVGEDPHAEGFGPFHVFPEHNCG